MATLTELDTRILEFAERREQGAKEHPIQEFGWLPTTYTMRLLQLVGRADVEADPRWTMLVKRIRKVTADRVDARVSRRFRAG